MAAIFLRSINIREAAAQLKWPPAIANRRLIVPGLHFWEKRKFSRELSATLPTARDDSVEAFAAR
jgi:hypothetical protein